MRRVVVAVGVLVLASVLAGCGSGEESLESVTAEARDAGWDGAVIFDDGQAAEATLTRARDGLALLAGGHPSADCAALEDDGRELSTVRLGGADGLFYESFSEELIEIAQVCQLAGGTLPPEEPTEMLMQANEQLGAYDWVDDQDG